MLCIIQKIVDMIRNVYHGEIRRSSSFRMELFTQIYNYFEDVRTILEYDNQFMKRFIHMKKIIQKFL